MNRENANKINMLHFSAKIDNCNKFNKLSYLCTKAHKTCLIALSTVNVPHPHSTMTTQKIKLPTVPTFLYMSINHHNPLSSDH